MKSVESSRGGRPIMVDVCVSVTMHKSVRVPLADYKEVYLGKDEDGDPIFERSYENDSLVDAVERNITLPQDRFKDWSLDEFEVVEE